MNTSNTEGVSVNDDQSSGVALLRLRRGKAQARRSVGLQDVYWPESVVAAQLTECVSSPDEVREYIRDRAFHQPSKETRDRYSMYFLQWFMPSGSLDDPVPVCWRAFHDPIALEHVMRWQFITCNPLIAGFVDGPLSHLELGESVNAAVDSYLAGGSDAAQDKTRIRLRSALTKAGLLAVERRKMYSRIEPDVSVRAVAIVVGHIFAPTAQAVGMDALVANPWWKRLGLVNESAVRAKLRETADAGLFARVSRMDTLDHLTTRYSWRQFSSGEGKVR